MDDLLKNTLIAIYYDDPLIIQAIDKLDFTEVNYKFKQELFARIDMETLDKVDAFLRSDDYAAYRRSIDGALYATTTELAKMMQFVTQEDQGSLH